MHKTASTLEGGRMSENTYIQNCPVAPLDKTWFQLARGAKSATIYTQVKVLLPQTNFTEVQVKVLD